MSEIPGAVIDNNREAMRARIKTMLLATLPKLEQEAHNPSLSQPVRERARRRLLAVKEDLKDYQ